MDFTWIFYFVALLFNAKYITNSSILKEVQPLSSQIQETLSKTTTSLIHLIRDNSVCTHGPIVVIKHTDVDVKFIDGFLHHVHYNNLQLVLVQNDTLLPEREEALDNAGKSEVFIYILDKLEENCFVNSAYPINELNMWNSRGYFFIIITSVVSEISPHVERVFKHCWEEYKLLNIRVLFSLSDNTFVKSKSSWKLVNSGNVQVLTYNPFKGIKDLINIPVNNWKEMLPSEKLRDLHGYPLKVCIAPYPPKIFESIDSNGQKTLKGTNGLLLSAVLKHMNMTLITIPPIKNIHNWAFPYDDDESSLDIFINGIPDIDGISASYTLSKFGAMTYPHDYEVFTCLVPKAQLIPRYMNLILPFREETWWIHLVTCGVVAIAGKLLITFNTRHGDDAADRSVLLETYQVIVTGATTILPIHTPQRFFLILCLIYSLIMSNAYQSSLTSYLTQPKYYSDVNTLTELEESTFKLALNLDPNIFSKIKSNNMDMSLVKRFVFKTTFSPNMSNILHDASFHRNVCLFTGSFFGTYQINQRKYQDNGRPLLHLMTEYFHAGPVVFRLAENSPYLDRLNSLFARIIQSGLYKKWKDDVFSSYIHIPLTHMKPLSKSHLQSAFYILFFGLISSLILFLVEIVFFLLINYLGLQISSM